jgi:hypothetical protein
MNIRTISAIILLFAVFEFSCKQENKMEKMGNEAKKMFALMFLKAYFPSQVQQRVTIMRGAFRNTKTTVD